ncbi:MAG: NAD(P)H-dependent oxidoreductase [Desulfobacteraceae bacterium]|jgi:multimeric flavodoxin WrbA
MRILALVASPRKGSNTDTLMDEADLIIFGTPNYWYGPTAKMKLLIDRMRPYVTNEKLKGKKQLL